MQQMPSPSYQTGSGFHHEQAWGLFTPINPSKGQQLCLCSNSLKQHPLANLFPTSEQCPNSP